MERYRNSKKIIKKKNKSNNPNSNQRPKNSGQRRNTNNGNNPNQKRPVKRKTNKTKDGLIKKSVMGVSAIVLLFLGAFVFVANGYLKDDSEYEPVDYTSHIEEEVEEEKKDGLLDSLLLPPQKTNVLVLGTDQSKGLTDVVLLVSFDRDDNLISIISVPRDLHCDVDKEIRDTVKEKVDRTIPPERKITELHSSAGAEMGPWAVKTQLESMLGIKIDYTARIDLDAFVNIVDLVGPIEMEIPAGGFYYNAPDQNLTINVPGGLQQLDGKMAEGVVRYRHNYAGGDLQRIGVQQEFMKQFFKQVLNKDTLMNNALGIIKTVFTYVETDFKFENTHRYLPYIPKLNENSIVMYTLPGEGRYVYYDNGGEASYFFHDVRESQKLMDKVFFTSGLGTPLNVEVYKGENTDQELLENTIEKLEEAGHNIIENGYEGQNRSYTRIIVKDEETGERFTDIFKDGKVEIDENLDENCDGVIVLAKGSE